MSHSTNATANDAPRWPTPDFLRFEDPNAARIADWAAGDSHNTAVDRHFGEQVALLLPVEEIVRRNVAFATEMLHHALAHGIRQVLVLGCGMPTGPVWRHQATLARPGIRAVYVDYDPIVTAAYTIARQQHPNPASEILTADLRDPDAILTSTAVRSTLDLAQPVLLLATAVLHHVPDRHKPADILARYRDALAPGSYLAISHLTTPDKPEDHRRLSAALNLYRGIDQPLTARSRRTLNDWLADLDPIPTDHHDGPFLHCVAAHKSGTDVQEQT
ncbi:SAM-dependent methyltransferase [Amycolatopsis minnesotensis]|uniref:SAM-dependent methyltransferase n=1 Tax=Amycolatopsis minnesotensis TaxID=337894 RepID=A0ABN2SU88_9PSEU